MHCSEQEGGQASGSSWYVATAGCSPTLATKRTKRVRTIPQCHTPTVQAAMKHANSVQTMSAVCYSLA